MPTINSSEELDAAIHDPEALRGRSRSPLFFAVALLSALALTAALLGGYFLLRSRHAAQTLATEQQQKSASAKQAPEPELKIFEDQAMIKGTQVTIAGTVQNISGTALADLSLELQLTRRVGGGLESRTVALTPKDLNPGEQARYSLTVLSREFRQARVLRVKSGARGDIAFATAPGNQRPAGPPPSTNKTIIVNRPAPANGNGDFINTPDNPTTIR
jgi:hypothetical protein